MTCRLCLNRRLTLFLDLGYTPLADAFLRPEQLATPEIHYPLVVCVCEDCGFIQLSHVVPPEILYQREYPYESSTTVTGQKHWEEMASTVCRQVGLGPADLVVDIGSNVGVLLGAFRQCGVRVQGVDPAANIVALARQRGIPTMQAFFDEAAAQQIVREQGQASAVVATNVVAHVDDLHAFMKALRQLLRPDGVFVFEAPYFGHLLDRLAYDTIYHEHLSYISVKPLVPFFRQYGLELCDIQPRDIHGGTYRYFVAPPGRLPVSPVVAELVARETAQGLDQMPRLQAFAEAVAENRRQVQTLLYQLRREGHRLAAVSAPAKGMTFLNYCRLGPELLDFITEKSPLKIGRYTPGLHLPVLADSELRQRQPAYALLLAWNFADEIMRNLADYRAAGGRFIIALPSPRIV